MASIIVNLFFSLSLFSSLLSISSSSSSSSSIYFWCNQTPHPKPCKYHMKHSHHRFRPRHPSEFSKMLVQLALDQAQTMHKEAQEYGSKCVTKMQKCAFSDCLKLNDNTIFHLTRTLHGLYISSCSLSDAQTWLSTSLTNIETCRSVALQLGVGEFTSQNNVSDNVRKMISNVLAVNGKFLKQENYTEEETKAHEFPSWFSQHDQRLLSSRPSSVTANNLAVAQDGTGHFKMVQAAIDVVRAQKEMNK